MYKIIISIIIIFSSVLCSNAQNKRLTGEEMLTLIKDGKGMVIYFRVEDGDTIYTVKVRPVVHFSERKFKNKRQRRKYYRMARNVKKVYPYAIMINNIFKETEFVLSQMDNDREKRKYIKIKEKELKRKFESVIREMTYTQGRILIKLVDRQTGHTTYELVQHFKGNVSAIFWQSIARIFSTNLKYEFDAKGDDKWIEEIVYKIEYGLL